MIGRAAEELLDKLERREAELLSWGIIDTGFSRAEVTEVAAGVAMAQDVWIEPTALIDELRECAALLPVPGTAPVQFRTRSAETLRLLATLRQWFPGRTWSESPKLVSDYRYALGPRYYPSRSKTAANLVDSAGQRVPLLIQQALALLTDRGPTYRFADFQIRATEQVLNDLSVATSRGVVVSAGTGSGKTLAFYLPALAWAASQAGEPPGTRILALYPRTELLKDQFQAAYRECRLLDPLTRKSAQRPLRIAALYGATPLNARTVGRTKGWEQGPHGFDCPLMRCPQCTTGTLLWGTNDQRAGRERLVCKEASCRHVIEEGEVLLTREAIQKTPPDVLFTTTEMLNRRFTDTWTRHVFGLGPGASVPRIVLLDEVHVYGGPTGAQTALLLRRWRNAVRTPVAFVGLSATLVDAAGFFSDLTGLPSSMVVEVSPRPEELIAEGMEYSLAIRSNPASGTSQLSTSIQAAMLLRRMLDTPGQISRGLWGQRLYAFTDQLDSVNRLFWDLLSAEGWRSRKTPLSRTPRSLAALRSPERADTEDQSRYQSGQRWDAVTSIGHQLGDRDTLQIRRTSSQDSGVELTADVVVATASLEVGFDDPTAGAVLQHKAPRDNASFIQRKGRAGRVRGMRPWTVTVLSDYGRDRLAYESYDELFNPTLKRPPLPISNRYILRMQATYALMDFLGSRLPHRLRGNVWDDLARPAKSDRASDSERQRILLEACSELLTKPTAQEALARFLSRMLQIPIDEAQSLLWEGPRSILLEVIPTAHRRLSTAFIAETLTLTGPANPLPEFVPPNLFSDLLVPEVDLYVPSNNSEPVIETLPIAQAMTEFFPGRASKRFAVQWSGQCHWIPIPLDASGDREMKLDDHVQAEPIGVFTSLRDGKPTEVPCFRPLRSRLEDVPVRLSDSTLATPVWESEFLAEPPNTSDQPPRGSGWQELVGDIRFHLHVDGTDATVRRFAQRSSVDLKWADGTAEAFEVQFVNAAGSPIALGFEMTVDAMHLVLQASTVEALATSCSTAANRGHVTEQLRRKVRESANLSVAVNRFRRDWLSLALLCALADSSVSDVKIASVGDIRPRLRSALVVMTDSGALDGPDEPTAVAASGNPRLTAELLALVDDDDVVAELLRCAGEALASPIGEESESWLGNRILATVGAAVHEAICRLLPQVDGDSLLVDLIPGTDATSSPAIWISEDSTGGIGSVEALARAYAADPRRFWRLVEAALRPTDAEVVDLQARSLLDLAEEDSDVVSCLAAVRDANREGNEARRKAAEKFAEVLRKRNVLLTPGVRSALNVRIARPGTSESTDAALREALRRWDVLNENLPFDLEMRAAAYLLSADPQLTFPGPAATRVDRFSSLLSVLWPRGVTVRASALRVHNRFASDVPTDRLLLAAISEGRRQTINVQDPDWRAAVTGVLATDGQARLSAAEPSHLAKALIYLQAAPIDVGWLLSHPRLVGSGTDQAGMAFADVDMSEVAQ